MVNHDNHAALPTVFQHSKRPQWGLSFLLWEIENKKSYLFENSDVRTLASDFSALMIPVEAPPEQVSAMLHRLTPQLVALQESRSTTPQPVARKVSPVFTLDEQWAFFVGEYDGGFTGETWRKKVRGEGATRVLKRHRAPLLTEAAKAWQAAALRPLLELADYRGLWSRITAVLCTSDLIPASQMKLLKSPAAGTERVLAETVFQLLHGEGETAERLGPFLTALRKAGGKKSTWQLATAILALYKPLEHVCVRSTTFADQAKSLQLKIKSPGEVSTGAYDAYQAMALDIKSQLEAKGHAPRDLLDIHDFIRVTRSPAARKLMAAKSVEIGPETELTALEHAAIAAPSPAPEQESGVSQKASENGQFDDTEDSDNDLTDQDAA